MDEIDVKKWTKPHKWLYIHGIYDTDSWNGSLFSVKGDMDEMTFVGENDHHPYLSIYSMSPTYIYPSPCRPPSTNLLPYLQTDLQ
jgi:hypothetical protein